MSNLTWPDKIPYPGSGTAGSNQQWTPAEVNELRDAVNSKEDTSNKATGFSVKDDTKFPTTKAVADFVGSYPKYTGTIDGTQDLSGGGYINSGFWVPANPFNATHASFPISGSKKCVLITFAQANKVLQVIYVLAANSNSYSEHWFRTFDPNVGSGEWGKWTKTVTADKLVTDLTSPDNNTFPTTLAIASYFPTGGFPKYLGDLAGNEDLNSKVTSGFWFPSGVFNATDTSFPVNKKGCLEVYANGNFKIQRYTTLPSSSGDLAMCYYRSGTAEGVWSKWMKLPSGGYAGSPEVESLTAGYTVSLISGSTDDNGVVEVSRIDGDESPTVSISITFNKADSNRLGGQITAGVESGFNNKYWIADIDDTSLTFIIGGNVGFGSPIRYYYSIFKK